MRVLFLSHTGRMSGGERALLELLRGLPGEVSPVVATPPGALASALRQAGADVTTVPAAEGSLRLHPLHTPIAVAAIARSALAVGRIARREGADVIHANSIRSGLVAVLAHRLGAPPPVVYVHDCLPDSRVANATRRAILRGAGVVLANSDHTAANFAAGLPRADVRTTYNGMIDESGRLVELDGAEPPEREEARARLGLAGEPLLGVVAQITPWKGQDTAIDAIPAVRREHPGARLLLAGEAKFTGAGTRFDNRAHLERLRARVAELELADHVEFLGERRDALDVIAALDVLLAPSWEEPFGRTIVEAMSVGTPVVATSVGGPAEIVEDGLSGRLVPPRNAPRLAEAVLDLAADPDRRRRMAEEGRRAAATRFTLRAHAGDVIAAYRDSVAG